MSIETPVPPSRPIPANLLMRAREDDQQAIETMFRQFLPEDEPVLFARYMGRLGFWWFGAHSLACLTPRRVATLRVAGFGEVLYQEGRLEDINSAIVYQPSKLGLYISIILSAVGTFGIALLFLPLITKAYYSVNKSGLVFCVAEGVSVYIFCNRRLIRKANELMRRCGLAREARTCRTTNSSSEVRSIAASPTPVMPDSATSSPPRLPTGCETTYRPFEYRRKPGRGLLTAYRVVLFLFTLATTGLAGSGIAAIANEYHYYHTEAWNKDYSHYEISRVIGLSAGISVGSGVALLIPISIIGLTWLGRSWSAVPREYRLTSPGSAVGLMLIPVFNFFWVFRAFPGLAKSLDWAGRDKLGLKEPTAGHNWAVATAVLFVIPAVNVVICPFVFLGFMKRADAARNRLLAEEAGA